ncbi:sensor histidine kinase [Chryseosolibacter indicus]|uniref:histidine kinase n=1 Tax=Chryseosolibacter indicus TaxID=2782351 RepID=A0ABS5VW59_9BACT|nr:HAMP domain-containing sensor histidine kinase [Chryseosolibacter indicus]MBT1705065.1 HAMP domain-containing histidine kinase [Chryseosolibacter indicus]
MNLTNEELIDILRSRLIQREKLSSNEREMFREIQVLSEKLKQSEKLKSHFLSNIRNEINNPLSSVLGLSRFLMESNVVDGNQLKRHAFLIHNEIFNLNFQMRNIFAAAEIEAAELPIEPAQVDVAKLINDCIEAITFKSNQKQVSISTSFAVEEIIHYTDGYMLFMTVINLLANAVEFSLPEGKVSIAVSQSSDKLTIQVKDDGSGIDEEDQTKIFNRFYQLDFGTTKRHNGHGLGLSIAKEFVEVLNGTLSVSSTRGNGSLFSVTIPSLERKMENINYSSDWNEFLFDSDAVL